MATTYGAEGIQILPGLEAVRKRPGMYIGSTDGSGLHHLLWEVVGNCIDQHLGNQLTRIDIEIEGMQATVRDDGPGISVAPHSTGRPVLEHVMTQLHAGPTFDNHDPHVHLRSDVGGAGVYVVNALSSRLDVETTRDDVRWAQSYEQGKQLNNVHKIGEGGVGTTIRFVPDTQIFGDTEFDLAAIAARLDELAHLLPRLRITFQGKPVLGDDGLIGWAVDLTDPSEAHLDLSAFDGETYVEIALAWRATGKAQLRSFVNVTETKSGTHVDGLWNALVSVLTETTGARKSLSVGLVGFLHVTLGKRAMFAGPTRDQLTSPEAGAAVERVIRDQLPKLLERDEPLHRFLLARLI